MTMNDIIQSQLDRVGSALATLIDSISSYNPSIPATSALITADDELNRGLKQLATHQRNHARILQLREQITQHNEQITFTLTTLASTRADLLATPTSLPPKETRNVPYTELLEYAKRISRFTAPPTFRPNTLPPPNAPMPAAAAVNGADTGAAKEGEGEGDGKGIGMGSLEDAEKKWLDPLREIPFVPWVGEDVMRMGALAQIQGMVERGEDPEMVGVGGVEDVKGEEKDVGGRMEGVQDSLGQVAGVGGRELRRQEMRVEKPKVFGGLDLYDPDDE
ncbi:hypothetical protein N7G274_004950 [Stereocaulon virgatum]|uniref:Mediator of RNA polymerase II transcription subunit 4 n=1 Tax=Stereocaulon virgatum TaxID=373712 RepID=A0ABR4AGD8_9LECA